MYRARYDPEDMKLRVKNSLFLCTSWGEMILDFPLAESEEVVTGDALCFASLADHEQLREDRH